jgi:hypothetical protein
LEIESRHEQEEKQHHISQRLPEGTRDLAPE